MSFIRKPKVIHPDSPRNELGLTVRDYEGGMSTLCAGCGHDSVTGAIVQAAFELSIPPHRMAKLRFSRPCATASPSILARVQTVVGTKLVPQSGLTTFVMAGSRSIRTQIEALDA